MTPDGLGLEDVAALRHETPYFLFSRARLHGRLEEFRQRFPGATVHYALKANAETAIVRMLVDAGVSFEAASRYELELLEDAGVCAGRILYGTSVKPAHHIRAFAAYGVNRFVCDHASELEKIAANAPGARTCVRLVVNDRGSVFKFSEKFGTDRVTAARLLRQAREIGLHPYGVSFHVGSQARNAGAWAAGVREVALLMRELDAEGIRIEALNLGGGFPCQYASTEFVPTLAEIAERTFAEIDRLPYRPQLLLEPGRGLVAEAGVLVASVIARIPRGEHTWLFLDAGVYNGLFEAMAYQGSTRYPVESIRLSNASGEALFALAGPTGDAPDVITREALLPADTDVGDRLIVRNAGAYSLSVTSRFNGFPKPPVYVV